MRITGGEIRQVEKEKQKKQDSKKRAIIEAPGQVSDSQPNAVVFPRFCFLMPEPLLQLQPNHAFETKRLKRLQLQRLQPKKQLMWVYEGRLA